MNFSTFSSFIKIVNQQELEYYNGEVESCLELTDSKIIGLLFKVDDGFKINGKNYCKFWDKTFLEW